MSFSDRVFFGFALSTVGRPLLVDNQFPTETVKQHLRRLSLARNAPDVGEDHLARLTRSITGFKRFFRKPNLMQILEEVFLVCRNDVLGYDHNQAISCVAVALESEMNVNESLLASDSELVEEEYATGVIKLYVELDIAFRHEVVVGRFE